MNDKLYSQITAEYILYPKFSIEVITVTRIDYKTKWYVVVLLLFPLQRCSLQKTGQVVHSSDTAVWYKSDILGKITLSNVSLKLLEQEQPMTLYFYSLFSFLWNNMMFQ